MLASMFLLGGSNAIRNASVMAPKAQPLADQLAKVGAGSVVALDAANLVRLNGVIDLAAGAALATGRFPRLAAAILAASMAPTTVLGHQFWKESEPIARKNQLVHFTKNLSMTGGLLMAALDRDPR